MSEQNEARIHWFLFVKLSSFSVNGRGRKLKLGVRLEIQGPSFDKLSGAVFLQKFFVLENSYARCWNTLSMLKHLNEQLQIFLLCAECSWGRPVWLTELLGFNRGASIGLPLGNTGALGVQDDQGRWDVVARYPATGGLGAAPNAACAHREAVTNVSCMLGPKSLSLNLRFSLLSYSSPAKRGGCRGLHWSLTHSFIYMPLTH